MANALENAGVLVRPNVAASPLQTGDHYILRKLCNQVLPWIISGRRLRRHWLVRLATLYSYTNDMSAALAGLGIGAPIAALISSEKSSEGKGAVELLRDTLPAAWFGIGAAALVVWLALRLVVQREDVIARALLARNCAQSMSVLYQQLLVSLSASDPMQKITEIQRSVDDQVQNAIRNKVWIWDPLPPQEVIADELKTAVDSIRTGFMTDWAPAPPGVL
jgi:hypothetical protein